ncbi:hypothetical protein CYLTODRAFT_459327 [Cylindrobasidium torrendii FP15055 ss-10]|uniref:Uncharacterized protein n=1 Tax=Cylindrobasidium torrendii FP15055 ss-10 TaxID=1314674 RepID=A0A0D7AUK3_9AGAR|nr:hypothetical protein CYLTODRAFT_459327 [Cylindrobasidium torrendii FP15055 ss-10]
MSIDISSLRFASQVSLHSLDGLFTTSADSASAEYQQNSDSGIHMRASEDTIVAESVGSTLPEDKAVLFPPAILPSPTNIQYESAPAQPIPCPALPASVDALKMWQETNARLQKQADAFQRKERRRYGLDLDKHEYSRWSPDSTNDKDVPCCLTGVVRLFTMGFCRLRDALAGR